MPLARCKWVTNYFFNGLFSKQLSWNEAWSFCCKLDMRLLTVFSEAKVRFMANLTNSKFNMKC